MKKCKKIISFVLALAILAAMSTTAFAAELNQNTTQGDAKVVYKAGQTVDDNGTEDPTDDVMGGTYTVTIPEYIVAAKQGDTPTAYNVTAENVLIPYNTSLKVNVTTTNKLKLTDNTATAIGYDFKANPQGESTLATVASGSTILTKAAGDPDTAVTSQVAAVLTESPDFSGTYIDTVSFTIVVD